MHRKSGLFPIQFLSSSKLNSGPILERGELGRGWANLMKKDSLQK